MLISICSQGLVWSLLALGLYITFRILDFADMTAEGSLTLGGSISAVFICMGFNPILSFLFSGVAGSLAGLITGILHTKLKIPAILSGILTMISLYSVNIKIMGKANISLLGRESIFSVFPINDSNLNMFVVNFLVCLLLLFLIDLFFKTQIGLAIRATGDNENMMRAQGANTDFKKILALMMSNGICGLAGSLIAQSQGYADVNMGVGSIVIALASIVIGEALISKGLLFLRFISLIVGSIVYRMIIFTVLNLGMNPSDLKLFTAIIASILLSWPKIKRNICSKKYKLKRDELSVKN